MADAAKVIQNLRAKYPDAYDDLDDATLLGKLKTKYPGSYDDLEIAPKTSAQVPEVPTIRGTAQPIGKTQAVMSAAPSGGLSDPNRDENTPGAQVMRWLGQMRGWVDSGANVVKETAENGLSAGLAAASSTFDAPLRPLENIAARLFDPQNRLGGGVANLAPTANAPLSAQRPMATDPEARTLVTQGIPMMAGFGGGAAVEGKMLNPTNAKTLAAHARQATLEADVANFTNQISHTLEEIKALPSRFAAGREAEAAATQKVLRQQLADQSASLAKAQKAMTKATEGRVTKAASQFGPEVGESAGAKATGVARTEEMTAERAVTKAAYTKYEDVVKAIPAGKGIVDRGPAQEVAQFFLSEIEKLLPGADNNSIKLLKGFVAKPQTANLLEAEEDLKVFKKLGRGVAKDIPELGDRTQGIATKLSETFGSAVESSAREAKVYDKLEAARAQAKKVAEIFNPPLAKSTGKTAVKTDNPLALLNDSVKREALLKQTGGKVPTELKQTLFNQVVEKARETGTGALDLKKYNAELSKMRPGMREAIYSPQERTAMEAVGKPIPGTQEFITKLEARIAETGKKLDQLPKETQAKITREVMEATPALKNHISRLENQLNLTKSEADELRAAFAEDLRPGSPFWERFKQRVASYSGYRATALILRKVGLGF